MIITPILQKGPEPEKGGMMLSWQSSDKLRFTQVFCLPSLSYSHLLQGSLRFNGLLVFSVWLRLKLEGTVTAFKDRPSKSYHGHLLLLHLTARWWELRRPGWSGCTPPNGWTTFLIAFSSPVIDQDITHRLASSCIIKVGSGGDCWTLPRKWTKKPRAGSVVKEIYKLVPEWPLLSVC